MFQNLSELTTYFIHQVIEKSEKISEFSTVSRPLVCASFMRLYSALHLVERYSHEFNAELYAISKGKTPLSKVVLRSKNDKLFASIENFNFQLLNLEYLGNYHLSLFRERNSKAVWHYPDEWHIDMHDCILKQDQFSVMKRRYAIYPFILTAPILELDKKNTILKYLMKIPTANLQAKIVAAIPFDKLDFKAKSSSDKISFGYYVNRGASGIYEYILSGKNSRQILVQLICHLLEIQEIDLGATTKLRLIVEEAQSSLEAITRSRDALSCFIKHNFVLDEVLT